MHARSVGSAAAWHASPPSPPSSPCSQQGVADAILSARDASQLIAVTHPEAGRQMQRCAAQMVGALQQIQAAGGH